MGKRAAIVAVVVLVAAVAVVGFRWGLIPGMASGTYYTQVDNTQVREQESDGGIIDFTGGMPLLYTLPSYDENGSVPGPELWHGTPASGRCVPATQRPSRSRRHGVARGAVRGASVCGPGENASVGRYDNRVGKHADCRGHRAFRRMCRMGKGSPCSSVSDRPMTSKPSCS